VSDADDGIPTVPVREWEGQVYEFLSDGGDPPADVRERGRRVVVDVLSAAVAGAVADGTGPTRVFPDGPATVLGTDCRVGVGHAALANATAAIAQEVEEGHDTGGHVGAGIVAGSVGVAEAHDVDGAAFVDACVRAYELCVRLERAIFGMKGRINDAVPWLVRDPHSTWTVVGPAVASALCLDASATELRETFRTAANLAVVSMDDPYDEGPPARNLTAGLSAQAGVTAALACAAGLRGSAVAIERVYDPLDEAADGFTADFDALGGDWEVCDGYHKPYPSCRYTHAPIDALRAIDPRPDPDAVDRIDVYTYGNGADLSRADPATPTAAKFSTPYVLARLLHDGAVALDHFDRDSIADPAVRRLAERVALHPDDEFEAAFPERWGARVEVTTTDDERLIGERAYPRGDRRDPMDDDAFRARTRALLAWGLDREDVDRAAAALHSVDQRPVGAVVAHLRG
jgi:2-methylcitrate dehydratase PrpD